MALMLAAVGITLESHRLIQPFSLAVEPGEIVTLMGPSGSGKSSLLSCIAGDLETPFQSTGTVMLNNTRLDGLSPETRNIGRLFQDDLLFPHLTVGENLLFGMARGNQAERQSRLRAALADAGLAGFENRPPHTLSGGQRARVALLRALLAAPAAMLLDEPFGKLDTERRASIRGFVFEHLRERKIPCLLVTHDRADAPGGARVLKISATGEVRHD